MKYARIAWIAILSTLLAVTTAAAQTAQTETQIMLATDRQELTVGDPIMLTLTVTHPAGYRVLLPEIGPAWGDFDVQNISLPQIARLDDSGEITTFTIQVTLFRTGTFTTPPLTVTVSDDAGQQSTVTADPLTFTVASVLTAEDTTLRDIKGQADLPVVTSVSVSPIAIAALGLALGGLIGVILYRRHHQPLVIVDTRTPSQIALDELQRIQGLVLPAQNEMGMYCDLISACVRQYVEDELSIPATDRTTNEIKQLARQSSLSNEQTQQLIRLLSQCDLVKFSGWSPDDSSTAHELLIQAGYFVENTRSQDTASTQTGGQAA